MLTVSVAACLVLVAQIANLIASAILRTRSAISTIIVTVIIEMFAAGIILYLFNPTSAFVKSPKEIARTTASTGARSKDRSSTASVGEVTSQGPNRRTRADAPPERQIKLKVKTRPAGADSAAPLSPISREAEISRDSGGGTEESKEGGSSEDVASPGSKPGSSEPNPGIAPVVPVRGPSKGKEKKKLATREDTLQLDAERSSDSSSGSTSVSSSAASRSGSDSRSASGSTSAAASNTGSGSATDSKSDPSA